MRRLFTDIGWETFYIGRTGGGGYGTEGDAETFFCPGMAYFVYVAVSLGVQFVILLLLQLLGTDVAALGSTASMAVSVAAMYLAA